MFLFKKNIYFVFFLSIIFALSSCGHLPADIQPNPASSGYHRMEFDIGYNQESPLKEIGIGNIYLYEDQDLGNIYFKFYGIYTGTLYLKSNACGINTSVPFDGEKVFYLHDLISKPTKCSISLVAETTQLNGKEHNIVETGEIKINVISRGQKPLSFEYVRTNSALNAFYKTYAWPGQASMQRQEGDLTYEENFIVKTGLTQGGFYRVAGCKQSLTTKIKHSEAEDSEVSASVSLSDSKLSLNVSRDRSVSTSETEELTDRGDSVYLEGTFDKGDFTVRIKDLYKKNYLDKGDTCDLEVMVIPNEIPETLTGRFSLSVYDSKAVPLETLSWSVKKTLLGKKLYASGQTYIAACSINGSAKLGNSCSFEYKSGKVYWVRAVTTNGRKSIFAIKDEQVFWKE